jgi:hypothetical protein
VFFFEKRNQKTFAFWYSRQPNQHCARSSEPKGKSFLLPFFENKFFLPYFRAWFASGAEIAEKPPTARSMFGDHDF